MKRELIGHALQLLIAAALVFVGLQVRSLRAAVEANKPPTKVSVDGGLFPLKVDMVGR